MERLSGAAEAAFDGAFGHAEIGGDLPRGLSFDVERLEQAAGAPAEAGQTPVDEGGGRGAVGGLGFQDVRDMGGVQRFGAAAAIVIEQQVAGDGLEPGQGVLAGGVPPAARSPLEVAAVLV